MLDVVFPIAYELIATSPYFGASSFHFTIFKFSFISRLIWPGHNSFSFHIIVLEFSFIKSTSICKVILSGSMKLAIYEISFIITAFELKSTFSCFFAFYEFSSEFDFVIVPGFCAVSMLLIILPLTLIHGSISINKNSNSICFSIFPFSLIYVSIGMGHSSFSVKLWIFSDALVCWTILKLNDSNSFPNRTVI